jgi:hypothetical protein
MSVWRREGKAKTGNDQQFVMRLVDYKLSLPSSNSHRQDRSPIPHLPPLSRTDISTRPSVWLHIQDLFLLL